MEICEFDWIIVDKIKKQSQQSKFPLCIFEKERAVQDVPHVHFYLWHSKNMINARACIYSGLSYEMLTVWHRAVVLVGLLIPNLFKYIYCKAVAQISINLGELKHYLLLKKKLF